MSNLNHRIDAFSKLGDFLSQFSTDKVEKKENILFNDDFFDEFLITIESAKNYNGWFTKENVLFACENWSYALIKDNLNTWLSNYSFDEVKSKKIALILAGNIPLVGFHDFLSVLISGHSVLVKQSSNDKYFLPLISKYLHKVSDVFNDKIEFTDKKLENFDAVIATGSNNTARYFDYYFKDFPSIIRKNRNSVAILTGNETEEELKGLADDIFKYFGLGCRSVSKIFIPKNYNFDLIFNAVYSYKDLIYNDKYANNYDYNKAVYLMSLFKLTENGFLMLKEDSSYSSPISSLFYEYYDDLEKLKSKIKTDNELIQCVVSNNFIENEVKFGQTQKPKLNDYADGIDTVNFLLKLN